MKKSGLKSAYEYLVEIIDQVPQGNDQHQVTKYLGSPEITLG